MTDEPALAAPPSMAGQFLVAKLCGFDARLAETVPRLLGAGDEEAVHDFRVALRRTRTLLEVGRPVFGRFYADEVRGALRDVHRASGALRDEEVLLELITSLEIRPEVAVNVNDWVEGRRRREKRLRGALRRKIREGELDRGRRLLDALVAFRIKPSRDRRVTKFARRAIDDARREIERRRGASIDDADALHVLRIAYKRLRYTVETFATVLPPELAALAQPASRFQSRLGKLHDADMAIACVRGASSLLDAGKAALLAELERIRRERASSFEQDLGVAAITPAPAKAAASQGGRPHAAHPSNGKAHP
jgi:CHAD domain-containing protein